MAKSKKKINIPALVGMGIGIIGIALLQHFFFPKNTYNQEMMQAASEINKSCPFMVDSDTRLDNTMAMPDNVFQYNYTLVNMEKATTDVEQLEEYLRPTIVNTVRTNPDMKINRDHKTTMSYAYKDKNGEFLFKILVTPDLYLN